MSTIEYEAIVHHCVKTGELWEDPEFPAVQSSVFYHQTPPFSFQWKRPHVSKIQFDLWITVRNFIRIRIVIRNR